MYSYYSTYVVYYYYMYVIIVVAIAIVIVVTMILITTFCTNVLLHKYIYIYAGIIGNYRPARQAVEGKV